jgi:hypothetical protein
VVLHRCVEPAAGFEPAPPYHGGALPTELDRHETLEPSRAAAPTEARTRRTVTPVLSMVRPERFELPPRGLRVPCSDQTELRARGAAGRSRTRNVVRLLQKAVAFPFGHDGMRGGDTGSRTLIAALRTRCSAN